MSLRHTIIAAIVAVSGIFATTGISFAQEAAATTALNVRSGPGTNFRVVGTLQTNQVVRVLECNSANTWCRIQDRTLQGWASQRYLRPIVGGGSGPRPPVAHVPAPEQPGISITTPNFSFSIGTGQQPVTPPRPTGQVCFYEEFNYNGRSFCVRDGDSARTMERFWDDRIRSARVEGNTSATVCTRTSYNGRCAVIDRSIRNLGALSDDISSYYVGRR